MKTNFLLVFALGFFSTVKSIGFIPTCASIYRNQAKKVSCSAFGEPVSTGVTYVPYSLQFYVMISPFYAAVMADALGYSNCCRGKNSTILKDLDLTSPWSGVHGPIAIDTAFGFDRNIIRRCDFPTVEEPEFICRGTPGTPGTRGESLGTIAYTTLMHDNVNNEWSLFGVCHNPIEPIGTSFIVISSKMSLPPADRNAIIAKLDELGFRTDNIFEPDFTRVSPNPEC